MCTFWQHLHGLGIFLVDVPAEKYSKNGQIGAFWPFFTLTGALLAYLTPTTGIVATPMSCRRVHTPYVHLLETSV